MESTEKLLRAGVVVGVVLALGPLWGFLVTLLGMSRAFANLGSSSIGDQRALANSVSLSLYGTLIGLVVCPVGVASLVLSLVLRARARRQGPPPLPASFSS